jgi:hypothetical protein
MADEEKNESPAPPTIPSVEDWSAISQGDLGLKAVYWTDETKTAIMSRPIVGWVTYGTREATQAIPRHGFAAVVIAPWWLPVLAGAIPNHACIAPKDANDQEILTRMREWAGGSKSGSSSQQGGGGMTN